MIKVGLILYSVREEMAKDPIATVEKVGELGYKNIEVCNHNAIKDSGCGFNVPAETLKSTFDKFGSKVVSAHIFPMEKANLPEVIEYNQVLGNHNIVCPNGRFTTYDDLMYQCERFNKTGKICKEAGMTYLYHNHYHEFYTINGKTVMDLMMENTDPDYLSLELDTFWVMRAGLNPVEQLKHFGRRVKLLHQKDFAWDSMEPLNMRGLTPEECTMPAEGAGTDGNSFYARTSGHAEPDEAAKKARRIRSTAFTEIGMGIMHIQDIIDAANTYTDAEYIILEQDATRLESQLVSIEKSMVAFKKYTGISWDN